jgi:metal-dependent amidase/aminoacylase/carboxypeptidase family protein
MTGLLAEARGQHDDLVRLRRELHREPELGLALPRTQERVLAALDGLPLEITPGPAELTSVVAVLRADPATAPFNHSPAAVFDEAVLPSGAALLARLAHDRLA